MLEIPAVPISFIQDDFSDEPLMFKLTTKPKALIAVFWNSQPIRTKQYHHANLDDAQPQCRGGKIVTVSY